MNELSPADTAQVTTHRVLSLFNIAAVFVVAAPSNDGCGGRK